MGHSSFHFDAHICNCDKRPYYSGCDTHSMADHIHSPSIQSYLLQNLQQQNYIHVWCSSMMCWSWSKKTRALCTTPDLNPTTACFWGELEHQLHPRPTHPISVPDNINALIAESLQTSTNRLKMCSGKPLQKCESYYNRKAGVKSGIGCSTSIDECFREVSTTFWPYSVITNHSIWWNFSV